LGSFGEKSGQRGVVRQNRAEKHVTANNNKSKLVFGIYDFKNMLDVKIYSEPTKPRLAYQ